MGGRCELCGNAARTYCESDEARLCWSCDASVHGANFLVARHPRSLLCRRCFSPTPWQASGPRLSPTLSLCHHCCSSSSSGSKLRDPSANVEDADDEADVDDTTEDDADVERDEDDGDNQVVPWSIDSSTPPPPPAMSSASNSGEQTGATVAGEDDEANSFSYRGRPVRPHAASGQARRAATVDYVASSSQTPPI